MKRWPITEKSNHEKNVNRKSMKEIKDETIVIRINNKIFMKNLKCEYKISLKSENEDRAGSYKRAWKGEVRGVREEPEGKGITSNR